jgi:hypothetical protein
MEKNLEALNIDGKERQPVLKRGSSQEPTIGFWDLPGGKTERSKFQKEEPKKKKKRRKKE